MKFAATSLCIAATLLAGLAPGAQAQPSPDRILLVLDASGSMNTRLPDGSGTRFEAARRTVSDMVAGLPPTTSVGLRVYGHTSSPQARNCQDSDLVVPFGPAAERAGEIRSRIGGLKALGYTPISLSLERAAADLESQPGKGGTVILVSDGRETCKADPCAVANALAKANAGLVVHTIGFGVDDATRRQLKCVANAARGSYFDAGTADQLAAKLKEAAQTAAASPPPARKAVAAFGVLTIKDIDEPGIEVDNSQTGTHAGVIGTIGGNRLELPAGIYAIHFKNGLWTGVEIANGATTEIVPARLKIENPAQANLAIIDPETSEELVAIFQQATPVVTLVPGRYRIAFASGFDMGEIEFKAGETAVIRPAIVRIAGATEGHYYRITAGGDGRVGEPAIGGADISLPAGRYTVVDADDPNARAVTFEVAAGETREVRVGR